MFCVHFLCYFYFIKIKIEVYSSCEIEDIVDYLEDIVEVHLCRLCVILRSHVLWDMYVLMEDIGRRLPSVLLIAMNSTRVNRVIQRHAVFNHSGHENYNTRFEGDKI